MKIVSLLFSLTLLFTASTLLAEEAQPPETLSEAELYQSLAPIALYPDSLLTHILIASTYPLDVVQADRWWAEHPDVEPQDASDWVAEQPWDPSVKALMPFPQILERMSTDLEWTESLGSAFLEDEQRVLAAVQTLRQQADEEGSLAKMDKLEVIHDEDVIIIQPAETRVVYVPYYDTRVVYGHWYWYDYPPIYWDWHWGRYHYHRSGIYVDLFGWYPSVSLHTHLFFGAVNWHQHHLVLLDWHSDPRRWLHLNHSGRNYYRYVDNRYAHRWHSNRVTRHYRHRDSHYNRNHTDRVHRIQRQLSSQRHDRKRNYREESPRFTDQRRYESGRENRREYRQRHEARQYRQEGRNQQNRRNLQQHEERATANTGNRALTPQSRRLVQERLPSRQERGKAQRDSRNQAPQVMTPRKRGDQGQAANSASNRPQAQARRNSESSSRRANRQSEGRRNENHRSHRDNHRRHSDR
ncbi:DUF3300 domain-containing protein [Porticoccaceae bacterium LTM1]|nr:DUF3300 domain-containing protein [Porticoccaceae bacterium LTM1]